jgi:hypothetical protein
MGLLIVLLALVFLCGLYIGKRQVFTPKYAVVSPCCMHIDIDSEDVIQPLEELIQSLKLKVTKKELTRDSGYHLDLQFEAPFLVQHVFIKRLYALEGLGRIVKI